MSKFMCRILITTIYVATVFGQNNYSLIHENDDVNISLSLSANNECEETKCLNGGTCVNLPSNDVNFTCLCVTPFIGSQCQCRSDLCPNEDLCGTHAQSRLHCVSRCNSVSCHCMLQGYTASVKTKTCVDVDECIAMDVCLGENEICYNYPGSYSCGCQRGYERNNSTDQCQDVNECEDKYKSCGRRAICKNTPGSYECVCLPGFFGPRCEDLGRCDNETICPDNSFCVNDTDVGNFCQCLLGFQLERGLCVDINECSDPHFCHTYAVCKNELGNATCTCLEGYELVDGVCKEINECESEFGNEICLLRNAKCVDSVNSFECQCKVGFYLENTTCIIAYSTIIGFLNLSTHYDVLLRDDKSQFYETFIFEVKELLSAVAANEMVQIQIHVENVELHYAIMSKLELNASEYNNIILAFCQLIDENNDMCLLSSKIAIQNFQSLENSVQYFNACDASVVDEYCPSYITTCHYLGKSHYYCSCNTGLQLVTVSNGIPLCADINECEDSLNSCREHEFCENTFGSYSCNCNSGFHRIGSDCVELCQPNPCQNNGECVVTGHQSCTCYCLENFFGDKCEYTFRASSDFITEDSRRLLYIVSGSLVAALIASFALGTLCYCRIDKKRKVEVARVTNLFEKYYQNEAVN